MHRVDIRGEDAGRRVAKAVGWRGIDWLVACTEDTVGSGTS